jgi:hypothetical protein
MDRHNLPMMCSFYALHAYKALVKYLFVRLRKTENTAFICSGIICQQSLQLITYVDVNCIIVVIYAEDDTSSSLQRTNLEKLEVIWSACFQTQILI